MIDINQKKMLESFRPNGLDEALGEITNILKYKSRNAYDLFALSRQLLILQGLCPTCHEWLELDLGNVPDLWQAHLLAMLRAAKVAA